MKISNIRVKKPGTYLAPRVKCPACDWVSEFIVYTGDKLSGESEGTCRNCQAVLTYHWEKE